MIDLRDAGEGLQFRWIVYHDGKPVAAFANEHRGVAYVMQLRKAVGKVTGEQR